MIVAVSPHLARPWRRFGRWVVALGVVGCTIVAGSTPVGTLAALLDRRRGGGRSKARRWHVGGTTRSRRGRGGAPQLGVATTGLEIAEQQVAGVFHVRGLDDGGRPLLVKVYGRDAHDNQLVSALWRSVWYRGGGMPIRLGRLQAAEHEAFVTLLAERAGLATREVVTAAATIDDDALLVLRGEALPAADLPVEQIDDAFLGGAWRALALLDGAKIAHQQIDPTTVAAVDGVVGFVDFGRANVAPDAMRLVTDRVQLLVTTASLAGNERALRSAIEALGTDGLVELLPYLQEAALSPQLRRQLKATETDVDDLRDEVVAATGIEPPDPVKLRRVTWWAAVQLVLLVFVSYTIIDAASGVDWEEVRSSVAESAWGWIIAGMLVAQLPRLTQALTTLGSVPVSLPFGPVYTMQLAMGYMNVALPSNLARMAVNIRFFQRQGLSAPIAVASGAIDSFVGTVVQAVLLGILLVFSESTLALDLPTPSGGSQRLIWILVAIVVASVLVLVVGFSHSQADRRPGQALVARRPLGPQRAARLTQAGPARVRKPWYGAPLRRRARSLRPRLRLRHLARGAARDQHQRLVARELRAGARRSRRRGVRTHPRPHDGRNGARSSGGRRAPLPDLDLLPPAVVGLLRDAVAADGTGTCEHRALIVPDFPRRPGR